MKELTQMTLKGDWSSETTYSVGDVVRWTDGNVYHLQKPCKAGVPPVDTLYWGMTDQFIGMAVCFILDALGIESGNNTSLQAAILKLLAPEYDKTSTYSKGAAVIYKNEYYVANQNIGTAEDWTAAHWTKKTLGELLTATAAADATIPDNISDSSILLKSSTASSDKEFLITVDDDGELTATEVTGGDT